VSERLAGSLAAACYALAERSAQILRVHDVAATRDAVEVFAALDESKRKSFDERGV
jgi:dihydropteroate synthase